ncbi:DUF4158 domain-containing protein [Citrobacter freundii]|uniref:DUF4158 domain-containing protein n=1 Tax=Enterobacter hormaechei TaxID=158836 RepID=UPI00079734F8|nr:DUF4158 domain-containing protein [Enterobacter hormaechei]CZV60416.1 Tn3-family transposase [Enterobacter hormaechei]SAB72909.1 Tn3-family transposase [Enterobacter hormaechei]SAF77884.1 Tn3-family transposase [Enterobacter hormaechei]SAG65261.1 Tn3-family transposase [Enterobacter hormaechei]
MPRRSILSAAERESLLALPDTKDELIRHYTFSESDLGSAWKTESMVTPVFATPILTTSWLA